MYSAKCPRITCRSTNRIPVAQDKIYKAGKGLIGAAVGGALLGPAGALVGAGRGLMEKEKLSLFVSNVATYLKLNYNT